MIPSAKSPEIDLSWRMHESESRLLTELLRTSRLTLLSADAGLNRSGLLTDGVVPLLRRRASDAVGDEDRESRVVIPFSDRRVRRAGRSSTRVAERLVLFDGWSATPIESLRTAILESLPDDAVTYARSSRLAPMLGELSRRFDAHFLVVFDGFERFWHPELTAEAAEQFVDEFSEAVNLEELRAHFLLSIDDVADARLSVLRQRIPGFDDSSVHLLRGQSVTTSVAFLPELMPPGILDPTPWPAAEPAKPRSLEDRVPVLLDAVPTPAPILPAAVASRDAALPKRPRRPRPPRVPFVKPPPIKTEGVYAFIESTLSQTASDFAPWQDEGVPPPATGSFRPEAFSHAPREGRRSMLESQGWEGRMPVTRPDRSNALIEPPNPIDKWLDSAFAWFRRRRR